MTATTATIKVFTKPSCTQCFATFRALDAKGLDHMTVDLTADEHWSGFRLDKIATLGKWAPKPGRPSTNGQPQKEPTMNPTTAQRKAPASYARHSNASSSTSLSPTSSLPRPRRRSTSPTVSASLVAVSMTPLSGTPPTRAR